MAASLPLFARLSHAYTAFTVAADNAFELRVPHRTTEFGGVSGAPWLVSSTLWVRFLRHIPADGEITVRDLKLRAALPGNEFKMWLTRFESWWGYLRSDPGTKVIRATRGGRVALLAFPEVLAETEARWRDAFARWDEPLAELVAKLEAEAPLPLCLSTMNYGLFSTPAEEAKTPPAPYRNTLQVLLAKALYAFALEYERETFLSMGLSADILRLIPPEGVEMRDLPRLSGIAKDAVGNALKLLLKNGAVKPYASPELRGKGLRRTERGDLDHAMYEKAVTEIEARWRKEYGRSLIDPLAASLPTQEQLLAAMRPEPANWRAKIAPVTHLPWFPMILHRGGFPDGS
jgi:hypothetical protein